MFNLDKYIIFYIFDFLNNYDLSYLKISKQFYKNIQLYLKNKIKNIFHNKIIKYKYFTKISYNNICENLNLNKSIFYFYYHDNNILINKFLDDNYYKIIFLNKIYIKNEIMFDNCQILYFNFKIYKIFKNNIIIYNFINKKNKLYNLTYKKITDNNLIKKRFCYIFNDNIYFFESYLNKNEYSIFKLEYKKNNFELIKKHNIIFENNSNFELINFNNKLFIINEDFYEIKIFDLKLNKLILTYIKLNLIKEKIKLFIVENNLYIIGKNNNKIIIEKLNNEHSDIISYIEIENINDYSVSYSNHFFHIFTKKYYLKYDLISNNWNKNINYENNLHKSKIIQIK